MNSRILTSLFLVCAFMISASSCAQLKASKNYVTKDVHVGNFNKIELLNSADVTYTQSNDGQSRVQIYGSDNLVEFMDISVNNGNLIIKFKKNTRISSWKDARLKVIASSPSLEAVNLRGSGDLYLESNINCDNFSILLQGSGDIDAKGAIHAKNVSFDLQGSGDLKAMSVTASSVRTHLQGSGDLKIHGPNKITSLDANLSGSGDLYLANVTANDVKAQLQGSGDLRISGTTRTATLALQASGDLDAKNLQAVNVTATLNGSGDLNCHVTGTLKAGVNGSGDIGYKGNPSRVELIGGRAKNIRKL